MLKFSNSVKYILNKKNLIFGCLAVAFSLYYLYCLALFFWGFLEVTKLTFEEFYYTTSNGLCNDYRDKNCDRSENCSKPAISEFPSDGFTREQRQHGWIILHIVLMFYGFWFLVAIFHDYVMPSVEKICSNFNVKYNVILAQGLITAAVVSTPQLFINFIGTFITKDNLGLNTVAGSALFNILAVPACYGLFVTSDLKFNWLSIAMSCLVHLVTIILLIFTLGDGHVFWYEALTMIITYILPFLTFFYNKKLCYLNKAILKKPQYREDAEFLNCRTSTQTDTNLRQETTSPTILYSDKQESQQGSIASPWSWKNQTFVKFFFRWPITFLLWLTLPNSRKYLTLILSILWIAAISYFLTFVVTIIGDTLNISNTVIGFIILAVGTSIPKIISCITVNSHSPARMGEQLNMSLDLNTFHILPSLGLPWFIKTFFFGLGRDGSMFITFNSSNLIYGGILMSAFVLVFYVLLAENRFILNRRVGVSCLDLYIGYMIIQTLMNAWLQSELYYCI